MSCLQNLDPRTPVTSKSIFVKKEYKGFNIVSDRRTSKQEHKHLPKYTFYTFINECEGSGLKSISPHLKLISRSDSLPTESSWSFLPSTCTTDKTKRSNEERSNKQQIMHMCKLPRNQELTFPCAKRTINVMEPSNTALYTKIFGVVLAQLLCCKLL